MPLQEFWNDDPDLLWVYRTLYIENLQRDIEVQRETINFQSWLQGLYTCRAIGSIFSKNVEYFSKPIDLQDKPATKLDLEHKIRERLSHKKMLLQQRRK